MPDPKHAQSVRCTACYTYFIRQLSQHHARQQDFGATLQLIHCSSRCGRIQWQKELHFLSSQLVLCFSIRWPSFSQAYHFEDAHHASAVCLRTPAQPHPSHTSALASAGGHASCAFCLRISPSKDCNSRQGCCRLHATCRIMSSRELGSQPWGSCGCTGRRPWGVCVRQVQE